MTASFGRIIGLPCMLEFFYRLDLLLTGPSAASTVMAISVVENIAAAAKHSPHRGHFLCSSFFFFHQDVGDTP
jgi:hypothetical protein